MAKQDLPNKGDRIVVHGNMEEYAAAYVAEIVPLHHEDRHVIILHWPNAPNHGVSRVYSTDEGKVWKRHFKVN